MRLAGGSPQADFRTGRLPTYIFRYMHMCGTREDAPTDYHYVHRVPNRNPCQTQGLPQAELRPGRFPTRRITTREALHKQNYDQGAYILPTSRITTRELASWLAGWLGGLRPGNLSCAWLAGWLAGGLAGWPAEAYVERPREVQRGPEMRGVDRTSLSCGNR